MEELRSSTPQDMVSLQMENELLLFEVRHLRAQLASADRRRRAAVEVKERDLRAKDRQLKRAKGRIARLERARGDLVWLVQRLESSPARYLFHRWEGFRRLVRIYGDPE
jgi:hypothetical protein